MEQNGANNANNSDDSSRRPSGETLVGRKLGKYRVLRRLGGGGMGIVYEAEDAVLKRPVALKVLSPRIATDPNATRRFLNEARAAARLNHPNIASIYEVGQRDGIVFLAMEMVRGRSLQERLHADGPIPWREAARIVSQVCQALEAAHAAGLIHRDIKPANILLREDQAGERAIRDSHVDDHVKLVDFGLAKTLAGDGPQITSANTLLGTPSYMSPEQCRGEAIDERSDLYALGATFFTLLTGHPPYVHDEALQLMFAHCSAPIPSARTERPELPASCDDVIQQSLAKDAFARFESARAMRYALKPLLADAIDSGATPPPPPPPPIIGETWAASRTQSTPGPVAPPLVASPTSPSLPTTRPSPAHGPSVGSMDGPPSVVPHGHTTSGHGQPTLQFGGERRARSNLPHRFAKPIGIVTAALGLLFVAVYGAKSYFGDDPGPSGGGSQSAHVDGSTSTGGTQLPPRSDLPRNLPETLDILASGRASMPGPVTCVALTRNGRYLAVGTEGSPSHGTPDALIAVWDLGHRKLLWWRTLKEFARNIRFTTSDKSVWIAAGSAGAYGFKVDDGQSIAHIATPDGAVQAVEVLPDDNRAIFGVGRWTDDPKRGGEVILVDVRTGELSERWDEPGKVQAIRATPDGRRLLICEGGNCHLRDPNNPRPGQQQSQFNTGRRLLTTIDVSPNSKYVALADDDGRLLVHGLPSGTPVLSDDSQPVFGKVSSLTFLADEKFICLGAGEGQNLRCVNMYTGQEEPINNTLDVAGPNHRIHDAYVSCVTFDHASRLLWSGSHDMRVCVTRLKK